MSGFVVQFYTSWYTQTADFLDSRFELNYFSIIRPLNFESINLIWNRIVFLSLIQPWKVLKYLFFKVCFFSSKYTYMRRYNWKLQTKWLKQHP